MTDKRKKATKVKCKRGRKRGESTTKETMFLECRTQNLNKIDQEKHKIKQIYIWNPLNTGLMMVNIDLRHQYVISVAEAQTSP